jgi:hypothetical protein
LNPLSDYHLTALHASAISDDVIRERGYRSVTQSAELRKLGFSPDQSKQVPGLLLPLHSTDGQSPIYIYRPDNPRVFEDKRHRDENGQHPNKVIKYEMPKGARMRLDCPPRCKPMLGDPKIPLWITEGQKKADALASAGLCSIAMLGVWNFVGTNEHGGKVWLSDWTDIALNGRFVRIVFDSDVMTKPDVRAALDVLTKRLQSKEAKVDAVYLPSGPNGKIGVDDWLSEGHSLDELNALVEAPRPAPQAAPDSFTLLDDAPPTISRPLALIAGRAYAATWIYGERKRTEFQNKKNGEVLRIAPQVTSERRRFILRDDGALFGDDEIQARDVLPLSKLGVTLHLPDMPPPEKLWSKRGISAYMTGYRPDPADVFKRVKGVVSRFMDFDLSLADQDQMAALIACYVLHTWLLDAFGSAGFLWVNGERGTGKSTLMLVICELAHLGQALSPSGSFAALRDIADYGACMGLDDAESWTNPEKTNPDIRAIVLSGNRRGVFVPVKEALPNGNWQTRRVNCFCPRVFTAIQKPDDTLSSRCIVIPLTKSDDTRKANADPLEHSLWPHDRQKLLDDLWALALARLSEMPAHDLWVSQNSQIVGRDLQPWRGLLAVAAWLDAAGVAGLWAQMSDIAFNRYQSERQELEVADLNRLVARAIREIAASQPERNQWSFSSSTIAETIKRMIEDEEIDFGTDRLGARSIGRKIGKLRLKKDPTARPRQWLISKRVLDRVLSANRLPSLLQQENLPASLSNGVDGVDGVDGVNNAISSNNTIIPDGSESEKTAISEPEALKEGYL